jgi:hypothetical protein
MRTVVSSTLVMLSTPAKSAEKDDRFGSAERVSE